MEDFVSSLNKEDLTLSISPHGMANIAMNSNPNDPDKDLIWTTDAKVELPIIMKKFGMGSERPLTFMDQWQITLAKFADQPALSQKIDGQWQFMTFNEYYEASMQFAAALTREKITARTAVTVLSYNCPEWFVVFNGTIFANLISCGLYITNQPEACKYVIDHCDSEICVVENQDYLNKILPVWDQMPNLKKVVVINDNYDLGEYSRFSDRVCTFRQFNDFEITEEISNELKSRMEAQAPGHCCSLVYTSGTTGNPKGVMLSHDNYTWINTVLSEKLNLKEQSPRIVSFLPLSHVAAQYADLVLQLGIGAHVYFADPMALRGTLIDYLLDVRPTIMLAVPRLYEKMEDKVRQALQEKPRIMKWAMDAGRYGHDRIMKGQSPGLKFKLFNKLVYGSIKKKLGLDQAEYILFGAAPMPAKTRNFFFDLNIFIGNIFGMSETSGPMTGLFREEYADYNLKSAGKAIEGTNIYIQGEDGEICFRGRNIFMGYLKNEEATRKTLDRERKLHSGDVGKLDEKGNLMITGRIKELLVTAGGENVAPVIIENIAKEYMPFASNIMLVGDQRKFIACMISLKTTTVPAEQPTRDLDPELITWLEKQGITGITTVDQAVENQAIIDLVNAAIEKTNSRVVSRAAQIRKWFFIKDDFTIPGGEFTPTLKFKRKVILQKYNKEVEAIYNQPAM